MVRAIVTQARIARKAEDDFVIRPFDVLCDISVLLSWKLEAIDSLDFFIGSLSLAITRVTAQQRADSKRHRFLMKLYSSYARCQNWLFPYHNWCRQSHCQQKKAFRRLGCSRTAKKLPRSLMQMSLYFHMAVCFMHGSGSKQLAAQVLAG